jgi:hypothetical protein
VSQLGSVNRRTIKEISSNKRRCKFSFCKILQKAKPKAKKGELSLQQNQPNLKGKEPPTIDRWMRAPYFKKFRAERRLISLMVNTPLPNTFNRKDRRILRGIYYRIPYLFNLLMFPPDQLMLIEMESSLYTWLNIANCKRASSQQIYRFDVGRWTFQNKDCNNSLRQSSKEPCQDWIIRRCFGTTGANQGSNQRPPIR